MKRHTLNCCRRCTPHEPFSVMADLVYREFFPPTETDLSPTEQAKQQHEEELVAAIPDPPTSEPLEEGQPGAKKLKIAEDDDEEWETLEKPESSAINGQDLLEEPEAEVATIEEKTKAVEPAEDQENALHTAEAGGGLSQNALLKDW